MLYIFDWDGTLCDSVDKIVRCTKAAARAIGIDEPTDDAVKNIIGLSLIPAIQQVFPGISDSDLKNLLHHYARLFKDEDSEPSRLYDGAAATISTLVERGHHIAVATGKSRVGLDRVLNALDMADTFHATRCADETASKPNPLMLQELLDEFGLSAQQAVMIGDTEYDMDMARQLSMPRIGVSYGAHEAHRLHPYEPERCLDNISELLTWRSQP